MRASVTSERVGHTVEQGDRVDLKSMTLPMLERWFEEELNDKEAAIGYDLDGDGDVGETGRRDAEALSRRLRISHEAWVACERIAEADLVLRHVIPIDQRYLVRGHPSSARL